MTVFDCLGPGLNGYQTTNAAVGPGGGNSIISSIGMVQQSSQMIPTPGLSSQMIPTPGFNNSMSLMSSDCSNGGTFSRTQTTTVSNQQRQRQHIANQNRRVLHSLGGQIGAGMRSNIQHKPSVYGFPNGVMVGGGLGLIGNNMQLVNGPAVSEGYLSTASYGSSAEQHFDQQHQQPIISSKAFLLALSLTDVAFMLSSCLWPSHVLYLRACALLLLLL